MEKTVSGLEHSKLWVQILVAMIAGVGVGLLLSPKGGALVSESLSLDLALWLKLPGTIFLNLIQMVVIPLVISSIILGISGGQDPDYMAKVGLRIAPYFVMTTTVAVIIGVVMALWIEPGSYISSSLLNTATSSEMPSASVGVLKQEALPEKIAKLIPTNVSQAMVAQNMLQIVIYALIIGLAIVALPKQQIKALVEVIQAIQDVALKIISWAMRLAPIAVFGLLADVTIRVGLDAILGVSVYIGTVILGLLSLWVVYLCIVKFLARRSVRDFSANIRDVQLLAFSTSSSAAVMPLSMRTAIEKLNVKPAIAKFIVPLGATVNMDGTALYQVVAALFLTQVYGIDLSLTELVLLSLTTIGASIGSPSTPGVGIVILATILQSIGVPASGIALIIGVDRILDMCRTAINVTGDLTACTVMDRWLETGDETSKAHGG